jgi:peptide/nickel transport system permease protein
LGVSILVFSIFWIVPGDVTDILIGDQSFGDPEAKKVLRSKFGLEKPFYVQYALWLWKASQGDLGISFVSGHSVTNEILSRIPINIQMISLAIIFTIIMGIPAGMFSAYRQSSMIDHIVRFATTFGYSVPNFWAATIVVLLAARYFKWLPVLKYVPFSENPLANIRCMLLPGFVLGLSSIAYVARMTRSSALDVFRQDYIRTARAKGASEKVILFIHVLKNSLIPVVTVLGLQMATMIGGFVLTEEVFNLHGVGSLLLMSIQQRDLVTTTGCILFVSVVFVFANLIVDVIYTFLDPRIKY